MSVIINPSTQQSTIALNADNIGAGGLPGSISESLIEVKYSYSGFMQGDIDTFVKGDIVVFNSSPTTNAYDATISKADTGSTPHASKMLLVFISYSGNTLV